MVRTFAAVKLPVVQVENKRNEKHFFQKINL